jgi:hypothetical protein
MIAAAVEKQEEAKRYLERALALNPKFDARQATVASKTLQEVGRASVPATGLEPAFARYTGIGAFSRTDTVTSMPRKAEDAPK